MPRIRTIKPEFHSHEELSSLPAETHLLAAALINYADDEGYFNANPILVKAGTNPLRSDKTKIEDQLSQLERIGYLKIHRNGSRQYGKILSFDEHQRVSHPTPSKIKDRFEELPKDSGEIPEDIPNKSGDAPPLKELNRKEQGREHDAHFVLPDWIPSESWKDWEDHRKKTKNPLSQRARELSLSQLEKFRAEGFSPKEVIDQSIMNGYRGLFPPSQVRNGNGHQTSSPPTQRPNAVDEIRERNRKAMEEKLRIEGERRGQSA